MGEVLSPKQAAKLLKVTTGTIYRWISEGKLAYTRLPSGYYRIPASEISRILTPTPATGNTSAEVVDDVETESDNAVFPPELF